MQAVHTLSSAIAARLACSTWWMPNCVSIVWCTAKGSPGGVPGAGGALPCSMPSGTGSMKGVSRPMATMRFSPRYFAASYDRPGAFV